MHRFIANPKISFKRTFFISLGLGISLGTIYWSKHVQENVTRYNRAYQQIPQLIEKRRWKHRIEGTSSSSSAESSSSEQNENKLAIVKSNESITIIDVVAKGEDKIATARQISSNSKSSSETEENLGNLSRLNWPDFIAKQNDDKAQETEFYVSIGVRKAFGEGSVIYRLGFTHAVVFVEKRSIDKNETKNKEFAVFGYNAGKLAGTKPFFMLNDMNNDGVSRQFTIYNELTIKFGNKKEVENFFKRMEVVSEKPYKVFTCNCFSPIFTAMIETSERAAAAASTTTSSIQVPDHFMESLAIAVPTEQNFGFGMSSNPEIKPFAELASAAVNLATKRQLMLKSGCVAVESESKSSMKK